MHWLVSWRIDFSFLYNVISTEWKNMVSKIKEIISYRDMIFSMVKRELRGRYQKSVLGMLWTLLNPLFQIGIYTFVFMVIFHSDIKNYYVYLTAGMVPWTFFNESVGQGASSVINNGDMTKKIYFPREVLPIASVTAKFINMLLAFIIVFSFIIFGGVGVDPKVIWVLPIIWIQEYVLALGFTLIFSSVTVYLRDMEYIVGVLMMAWIWGTPIMYSLDKLSAGVVTLLKVNPMTLVVMNYHDVLYYKTLPSVTNMAVVSIEAIVFLVIGEIVFAWLEGGFAEEM